MADKIEERVRQWGDKKSRETNLRLQHLALHLYGSYEPSQPPAPDFWQRLDKWLNNVAPDQAAEKILFNLIPELFYVGTEELKELYRFAYNGPIARWLIEETGLMLDDPKITEKLYQAACETWFCPISDSMRINSFYHVNNLPANWDFRPDWRSMDQFASEEKIRSYCYGRIKRLVLIEDFVGGGRQMKDAVAFASKFTDILSVLVVPLIICPKGMTTAASLEKTQGVRFSPVLSLEQDAFIPRIATLGLPEFVYEVLDLANKTYPKVSNNTPPGKNNKPYFPLGWDETGGLIVMCSNTPNNTLPLIHWKSDSWEPLFPRHDRI